MVGKAGTHWQDIQEKVFTRWCNDYLSERGMAVESLKEDLKDGLLLINLLEILSAKKMPKYNKHPRVSFQKMENLNLALQFIKDEGIVIVNIGSDDIASGNMRIILGLIWTLILRFEIHQGKAADAEKEGDNGTAALLSWVQNLVPEPIEIKGFKKDWNNGIAICALTDSIKPGLIPNWRELDPANKFENAKLGITTAHKALGIDPLIMPDEMNNPKVDKLALMTYLAQFRNIKPEDIKEERHDALRCQAYGPGLIEGLANEDAPFTIQTPLDAEADPVVTVTGPEDAAEVNLKKNDDNTWSVSYLPTAVGEYKVSVTLANEHIPGSVFTVNITAEESLGGEGKIRVFLASTSSSEKTRSDQRALERLLEGKKVHLLKNFDPWHYVDVWDKKDRDKVFKKAGTNTLPIIFVDDKYVGDYDALAAHEEQGTLDEVLHIKGADLVTEEEHAARLAGMDPSLAAAEEAGAEG